MDWMKNAWDWTKNLLGDTDYGDLVEGAKFAAGYFDNDVDSDSYGSATKATSLSGAGAPVKFYTPTAATKNKIGKSSITSQAEATVNKHRAILARAINQAQGITSKSKRT